MFSILKIATENDSEEQTGLADPNGEPNELEKANEMVQNEESTEPETVVKIANYKEELAALKEQQKQESDTVDEEVNDQPETQEDEGMDDNSSDDEDDSDTSAEEDSDSSEDSDTTDDSKETNDEVPDASEGLSKEDSKQLNDATEAYCTLHKLNMVAQKAKNRNSLTTAAFEMLQISLEGIKASLGVSKVAKYNIPAIESFDSYTNRQKYTDSVTQALEGIVSDVWDAIVRMFKAIVNWVSDFLFNKKKSINGARNDLRTIKISNKSLIKGIEKKEELKSKSSDSFSNVAEVPHFKSKEGRLLLAPGMGEPNMESVNKSLVLMTTVLAELTLKLDKLTNDFNNAIAELFNANTKEQVEEITKRSFIGLQLDTKNLEKTNLIKGEELSEFVAYKTHVLTLNKGYYFKFIEERDPLKIDKRLLREQRFGTYYGDDEMAGAKIPLISTVEGANVVIKWLENITSIREGNNKSFNIVKNNLAVYEKEVSKFRGENTPLGNSLARVLGTYCTLYSNVLIKGYATIDNSYEQYYKILTALHSESVKEYGAS